MEAGCGSVKAEASVSIAAGYAERWWLLQETEVAGRGDTEDFADLGKLARRFLDKNSSLVPSTAWRTSAGGPCPISEAFLYEIGTHNLQTLSEAGSKSVVLSQWTAFLDLLEIPLKRKNFCFVRLDGTLSQRQREQVLKNFSNIPAVAPSSESSIGQTKNVSIKRFIVKDSVEERMQQVQARKQGLIARALTDEEVRSARIEELKMLFR
ncbi:hypothetical protein SELMODRAFT_430934 [Selaginella moellendorffii]|uniref:Helicase C-terminal domain-containing protein n=1 Tax=Selaginella moellendorffii TaxID=88036 RepID=D8TB03_SELML|nr:hypothetical protein SELMODRAFT_430934 [Selaginella moellendorffii]